MQNVSHRWTKRLDALDTVLKLGMKEKNNTPERRRFLMKNVKDSDFVQELTIIRIYDEPRELVFKAWLTDPKLCGALVRGPDTIL